MSTTTAPVTPPLEPPADEYQLPVAGFQGTPEEIDRQWFEKCYKGRGDTMLQLTWRAIIMGSVLGGVLSVTNVYIGLKAGWSFGVAITACILSYAIWTSLRALSGGVLVWIAATIAFVGVTAITAILVSLKHLSLNSAAWIIGVTLVLVALVGFLLRKKLSMMTILENNCMQTASSAAGASTGGTLISAFAAYVLLNNQTMSVPVLMGWVFFLAVLGVTMAVPMKRQMINAEQLRFPSGVAAAETLKALYSTGGRGMQSAKALGLAGLAAMLSKLWLEGLQLIHANLARFQLSAGIDWLNAHAFGPRWTGRTVMISWEPMFIAAGAITGMRVCLSMLLGGVTCWMIFVPLMQHYGVITGQGFKECVQWTLWGGTACMVTSGLLSFGLQWRSALRAFRSLGKMFARGSRTEADPVQEAMDAIETPAWWFIGGQLVGLVGLAYMGHITFNMPIWQTVVAVLLSFALALVACRVTGETDTTPIGAMGKITQLTFGAIAPAKISGDVLAMNVNLMAANITAGAAGSSAALMTDLKSGYLLGAHPFKQFLAQFSGIFVGTVVTVLCFRVLVPDAAALGTNQFPAPAAQTWKAVAEALGKGLSSLQGIKLWSIGIGGAIGLILPILSLSFPKHAKYIPSAAGVGLAWVFQWYYAVLFFLGALIGFYFEKRHPKAAEDYTFPVASGVIAGESLMGVGLTLWENGPTVFHKLFLGG
jgi:OPT family oligopeptide transporter